MHKTPEKYIPTLNLFVDWFFLFKQSLSSLWEFLWSSISSRSCLWDGARRMVWITNCRLSQAAEPHSPPGRPPGVDKEVRKALVCLLWPKRGISSSVVKTYRPILHEFEAGAKVSQADVAVHIQQNIVGLDVPEKRRKWGWREDRRGKRGEKTNWASDSSEE